MTLARIYRALISASPKRQVRNAENALEEIIKFYKADAACLLVRNPADDTVTVQANAGKTMCLDASEDGHLPVNCDAVKECLATKRLVAGFGGGSQQTADTAVAQAMDSGSAAAPIIIGSELSAALYVNRGGDASAPLSSAELHALSQFAEVFREFPDLLIRNPS